MSYVNKNTQLRRLRLGNTQFSMGDDVLGPLSIPSAAPASEIGGGGGGGAFDFSILAQSFPGLATPAKQTPSWVLPVVLVGGGIVAILALRR